MKKVSKLNNVINSFLPTVPQMEHFILSKIAKKFGQKWVNIQVVIHEFQKCVILQQVRVNRAGFHMNLESLIWLRFQATGGGDASIRIWKRFPVVQQSEMVEMSLLK